MAAAFHYRARDAAGAAFRGVVEAENEAGAARSLMGRGLFPVALRPRLAFPGWRRAEGYGLTPARGGGELLAFTSQLAALLRSGVALREGLSAIIEQCAQGRTRGALEEVAAAVEGGAPPSEAMARRPDMFPETYRALVAAGEASGALDTALTALEEAVSRDLELRERMQSLIRYPAMVASAALLALGALGWFALPRYAAAFRKARLELPAATQALMAAADFLSAHGPALLAAALMAAMAASLAARTPGGAALKARLLLAAPGLGGPLMALASARWANTFSLLIESGVPLLAAMSVSARAAGPGPLRAAVERARGPVAEGESLAAALARAGAAAPVLARMVAVGERSGRLGEMLSKAALLQEREAQRAAQKLAVYAEAGLIVAVAGVVLFLALGVFSPMWELTKLAGGR